MTAREGFYVTVRHGRRAGFLLGPYATHDEALANVDRAGEAAREADPWAASYAYGTAKATAKPGRFNDIIGLTG